MIKIKRGLRIFTIVLFTVVYSLGCIKVTNSFSMLPPGIWRGVLFLDEGTQKVAENASFDEKSKAELPFNFEVIYDNPDSMHILIRNGEERIKLTDIDFGLDRATARDTLDIHFPIFDSYIDAKYEEDAIAGRWIVNSKVNYQIPFEARYSKPYRFFELNDPPSADISGKWKVQFEVETESPEDAIGIFNQNGNELTGTFLTETGDYRYLEGTVSGNRAFLSTFDGAHAFLFEAKILEDGTLSGIFRSGSHYKTYWNAVKDNNATIRDPYTLTYLKEGYDSFGFSFYDPETKDKVSLSDPAFEGKVKLIQILGTWCPNCYDETRFLVDYFEKNKMPDVKTVALAFERHADFGKANQAILRYKEKMNVVYPMLYAGVSDKEKASAALPMLNEVISYPTLIFIDRENKVRKIHTGFAGPATPDYNQFVKEFDELIKELVGE